MVTRGQLVPGLCPTTP